MLEIYVAIVISGRNIERNIFKMVLFQIFHDFIGIFIIASLNNSIRIYVISGRDHEVDVLLLGYFIHGRSDLIEIVLISSSLVSQITEISYYKELLGV